MITRNEKLNRLTIGFQCTTSWDAMQGDEQRRFCSGCHREVLDFAQMTPRQIRAHVEASRGKLCARLTRSAGQLHVLDPAPICDPAPPRSPRKASSLAATLVTAWLGVGATGAEPTVPTTATTGSPGGETVPDPERDRATKRADAPAADVTLHGQLTDPDGQPLAGAEIVAYPLMDARRRTTVTRADGTFELERLAAGVYDLDAWLEGFEIDPRNDVVLAPGQTRRVDLTARPSEIESVTVGVLLSSPESLRQLFEESDLVVAGVIGPSVVLEVEDEIATMTTQLRIEKQLKGATSRRSVSYRHSVYLGADGEPAETLADLTPGTKVLAFLDDTEETDDPRDEPIYEPTSHAFGIKTFGDGERAVYLERLEALARLERASERHGGGDPADLTEWLVATAEEPHTRGEVTGELGRAVEALRALAAKEATTEEIVAQDLRAAIDRVHDEGGSLSARSRPTFLGASLTDAQKQRLTAALVTTERLSYADRALFDIVRRWDEDAAMSWLVKQLRTAELEPEKGQDVWWLIDLAGGLGDETASALAEETSEKAREIEALWTEDEPEGAARLRQGKLAALGKKLMHELAEVLAGP